MRLIPQSYGEPLREFNFLEANDCHHPAGSPAGGQFCSGSGEGVPSLGTRQYRGSSARIPDYLKADVLAANRAGILVTHRQQPEPVRDVMGRIVDPLAKSSARHGEVRFVDRRDMEGYAPRGEITVTTRGGDFEPTQEVWVGDSPWNARREKKELTPEMLTDPASEADIVATFRHEVGHLIKKDIYRAGKSTDRVLASEITAWQYAVEASPDHRISDRMVRLGLSSHAYHVYRQQALAKEYPRYPRWDQDEIFGRMIQDELRRKVIDPEATQKAEAFTVRVLKSLDAYGGVLRKRGRPRAQPSYPSYIRPRMGVLPGPGRGGMI